MAARGRTQISGSRGGAGTFGERECTSAVALAAAGQYSLAAFEMVDPRQTPMATKQSVPAAAAAMLLLSTYAHVVAAQACNSTLEHGMQRSCNYGHDKAPGLVNTTAECAAACCARGPSTPYVAQLCRPQIVTVETHNRPALRFTVH